MPDKVLFVDDEPAVLDGYRRVLYPDFEIDTATGAAEAFAAMKANGPYAVMVSDMRMPVMNGAEFLRKVRKDSPDTVRMLLTGYTDIGSAIEAVNEGNIFRFLTKPCGPDVLAAALTMGIAQHHLITAEKVLLERTVLGSIKVLADVLNAASPEAFGHSLRIGHYVRYILAKLSVPNAWCIEAAATLSQLGCITLDSDLLLEAYAGAKLSEEQQGRFNSHPDAAVELLKNIPRLEPAAWMLGQQLKVEIAAPSPDFPGFANEDLVLGAKIVKLAVVFEDLRVRLRTKADILVRLQARRSEFEPRILTALQDIKLDVMPKQLRRISTARLAIGMVLDEEIRNSQDMLLVARGQEITNALILRLDSFRKAGLIAKEVMAFVPA